MNRLVSAVVAVLLLSSCVQAQYPYVQGSGCTGGQVTGQYLGSMQNYNDLEKVRFREVHRYRGNGEQFGVGYPPGSYYSVPSYGYGHAPSYGYQYGYPAVGGYGSIPYGMPSYYYSAPTAGFSQPYMQCGPNGCTVQYR